MPSGVTIKDIDLGFEQLGRRLKRDGYVDIGFFHGEKTHPDTLVDMAQIAIQNEFGTSKIPERSFMRSVVDENQKKIIEFAAKERLRVADGKQSFDKFLTKTGLYVKSLIQKKIATAQSWAVPNAPSTVAAKKGRETPLVDTSFMLKSVDYKKKVTK